MTLAEQAPANDRDPADDAAGPYPSEAKAYWVIFVPFLVTLFSQLDRMLPSLLVGPLKSQFGINDTAFSYLQGYAFALVYTLAGLPFGRLVDRSNRRNLIAIGLVIWSATTALSAFADTYWHFFACRMGVGIGEAFLAPAAYSMIADYVPPQRRARALGIYYISLAVGAGVSLFVGGMILRALPPEGLGSFEPWRLMFLFAGLPGLALVFLLITVREPVRREKAIDAKADSIKAFLGHIGRHKSAFARVYGYTIISSLLGYATLGWAPAVFVRRFDLNPADAGIGIGVIVLISGTLGPLISSWMSDRWMVKGVPAARLRLAIIGFAITLPGILFWPMVSSANLSLVLLGVAMCGLTVCQAAASVLIQDIAPNSMRGQAIAVFLLLSGLLGMGLGPTLIAMVTDEYFKSEAALPQSLIWVCTPLALIGLILCWSGLKQYEKTREEVHRTIA